MYYESFQFWSQLKMLTSPVLDSPTTYYYKTESKAKNGLKVRLKRAQNATHFNLLLFPQFVISTWNRKLKVRHEINLMQSLKNKFHRTKMTIFLNGTWFEHALKILGSEISSGTFKKYARSRFPSFDVLSTLVRFWAPPTPPHPHPRRYVFFWLELTLSPSIPIYLWNLEKIN